MSVDSTMYPWPSAVPSGWTAERLKYVATLQKRKTDDAARRYVGLENIEPLTGRSLNPEIAISPDAECLSFEMGDVLFGKLRPYLAKVLLASEPGRCTSECLVLRATNKVSPAFLRYVMLADPMIGLINSSTYGAKMPRAEWDFIGRVVVPIPPPPVQRRIVNFLDRKTDALDKAVYAKRRLAHVVAAKREALIASTLAHGLRPDAPMRDAGPLLGSVPSHWEVVRLKYVLNLTTSGSRGWREFYSDTGAVFLQSGNLGDALRLDLVTVQHVAPPAGSEGVRTRVQVGDVLVCITGAYTGNVALVENDLGEAYVNQHICLVRPDPRRLNTRFLAYYLASPFGRQQFELAQYGGTKQGLGLDDVRNIVLPLPPMDEQRAIVAFLHGQTRALEEAADLATASIDTMHTYRSALISAAVTGELNVDATKEAA